VQTFLPYDDFRRTAEVLDRKRLGKQRVECIQVLRGLVRPGYGWRHHPAVKMWRGHEEALARYAYTCCERWVSLGFGDTCAATIAGDLAEAGVRHVRTEAELRAAGAVPAWFGDEDFHRSHRSALLRKDPEHYGSLFTDVPGDLEYVWPTPPGEPRTPPAGY
jgi:hypothetical protein